ncbi:MAG TPA: FGGY-family carbohydrate kinase [Stenomitos sp.]
MGVAPDACWLGIDFGTSGARAIAIDTTAKICHEQALPFASQQVLRDPLAWQAMLYTLIRNLPSTVRSCLQAIAIDGTSSTVVVCDAEGQPVLPPLLYNDAVASPLVEQLRHMTPSGHCVGSASSSLAKLLSFQTDPAFVKVRYCLHQADWLAFLLHDQLGLSDYHNSLKLGYDPALEAYPDWFEHPVLAKLKPLLPRVVAPGTPLGPLSASAAASLDLPAHCQVCAGTTDSIAAFLASPAMQPGEAVTSLGSTLVLKLLSRQRVDRADYGIYSHRLGSLWLAGGASNTGGAVLAQFFTPEALATLSQDIDAACESSLEYYPLLRPGERFPVNDPLLLPRLTPRPADDRVFLHGLLESLARIEALGYHLLQDCGATPLSRVFTAGGGAQNLTWQHIRQRRLGVPVERSPHEQAAYGTALLALRQNIDW